MEFAPVCVCVYIHAEILKYKGESNKDNKKGA